MIFHVSNQAIDFPKTLQVQDAVRASALVYLEAFEVHFMQTSNASTEISAFIQLHSIRGIQRCQGRAQGWFNQWLDGHNGGEAGCKSSVGMGARGWSPELASGFLVIVTCFCYPEHQHAAYVH